MQAEGALPQSTRFTPSCIVKLLTIFFILPLGNAFLFVNGRASVALLLTVASSSLGALFSLVYLLHDEAVSNSFLFSQYLRGAVPFYLLWKVLCMLLFPLTFLTQVVVSIVTIMTVSQLINALIEVFPEWGAYLDRWMDYLTNLQPDLSDLLWSTNSNSTRISTGLRSPNVDVRLDLNAVMKVFSVILFATPGVLAMELCKWLLLRTYVDIVLGQYSSGVRIGCRGIIACGCIGALGLVTQEIYGHMSELFPNELQSITVEEGVLFLTTSAMHFMACMGSQALVATAEAEKYVLGMSTNVPFARFLSFCFSWLFHALSVLQSDDVATDASSRRALAARGSLVLGFCTFAWYRYSRVMAQELEEELKRHNGSEIASDDDVDEQAQNKNE